RLVGLRCGGGSSGGTGEWAGVSSPVNFSARRGDCLRFVSPPGAVRATSESVTLSKPAHEVIATVLGAGTMGAGIAAHLANAGCKTFLLDIVPPNAAKDAP